MISALASGSSGPGLSPDRVAVLCSWARHLHVTLTVPLSTQEYKWVLTNCQGNLTKCCGGGGGAPKKKGGGGGGGLTLCLTSIPPRGSRNTPSRLHTMETGISTGSVGQFGPEHLYVFRFQYDYCCLVAIYNVIFLCICPVIDHEFHHNIVNLAVIHEVNYNNNRPKRSSVDFRRGETPGKSELNLFQPKRFRESLAS